MQHETAVKALKAAAIITVLFGGLIVATVLVGAQQPMALFIDLVHLPFDGEQGFETPTERLLGSIFGGLMIGLGVLVWQVAEHIYRKDPGLGGRMISLSMLSWFITDSAGSAASGAWFNVALNAIFLALFLVPIALGRPSAQAV